MSTLTTRIRRAGTGLTLLGSALALPLGWRWSVGILAAGLVVLVNFMGMGMVVRSSLRARRPSPGGFVFYMLRLIIMAAIFALLLKFELADPWGLLAGVTLVVVAVLVVGWQDGKREAGE